LRDALQPSMGKRSCNVMFCNVPHVTVGYKYYDGDVVRLCNVGYKFYDGDVVTLLIAPRGTLQPVWRRTCNFM